MSRGFDFFTPEFREKTEEKFFNKCRTMMRAHQARNPIEMKSVLTNEDIERLDKLKTLRVRGRQDVWNTRRVRFLDCFLANGASTIFFEVIAGYESSLLVDLFSYLPRNIVKKWIEEAKTLEGEGGNLIYLTKDLHGWDELLNLMLSYGINYETQSDKGTPLRLNIELLRIRDLFRDVKLGLVEELFLQSISLEDFFAKVYARNAQGHTILQVALCNAHVSTANHIIDYIVNKKLKNFVLELSETMTLEELFEKSNLRLNCIKAKLDEFVADEDTNVCLESVFDIFENALGVIELWNKYEQGIDLFYGEPHLKIVEETLEIILGFDLTSSEDQVARCREFWKKYMEQHDNNNAKSLLANFVQMTLITPIEAFLKAIQSAKLYECVMSDDPVAAAKCISAGANVNLIERVSDKSFIEIAIDLVHERVAEVLLDNKAEVGEADEFLLFNTLLPKVIKKGSLKIVDAILRNYDEVERQRFVDHSAAEDYAPIYIAANLGLFDIVKTLMKYQATYCLRRRQSRVFSAFDTIKNKEIKRFFEFVDDLFVSVSKGDNKCLELIKSLPRDELLAVCNTCDEDGYNIAQIARINKHDNLAKEIFDMVRDADQ